MSKSEVLRVDTNLIKKQNAPTRGFLIKLVLAQAAQEQNLAVMPIEKYGISQQYTFIPTSFEQYRPLLESAFPELEEVQHKEIYIELAAEHPDGVICILEPPLEKIGYRPPIVERIFAVTLESLLSAACYRLNIMLSEQENFIDKFISGSKESILKEKLKSKYDIILQEIKEFHRETSEEKIPKIACEETIDKLRKKTSTFSNFIIAKLAAFEKFDIEVKHENQHQFTQNLERLAEQLANDEQRVKISGPDGEGSIFLHDVLMINNDNGAGEFQYLGRHYGLTKSQLEDYEQLTKVKLEPHQKIVTASAHAPIDQPWLANFAAVEKGKFAFDLKKSVDEKNYKEDIEITFITNRNGSTGIKLYARGDDHETAYRASQAISQQLQIRRAQLIQALLGAGDSPLKGYELRYCSNIFAYHLNDGIQNNVLIQDSKIVDKENKLVKEAIFKTLSHIINEWIKNKLPNISREFHKFILNFIVDKHQDDHISPNNLQETLAELEEKVLAQEIASEISSQEISHDILFNIDRTVSHILSFRESLYKLKRSVEEKENPLLMFVQKKVLTKLLAHSEDLVRVKHLFVHEITGKAIGFKRSEDQWHQLNDMRKIHHAFENYSYLAVPVNVGRWLDWSGVTAGTISVVMVQLFQNLLKKYSIQLKKDKWKNQFSLYDTSLTLLRKSSQNYIKFLEEYNNKKSLCHIINNELEKKKLLLSQLKSIPEDYRFNEENYFDKYLVKVTKSIDVLTRQLTSEEENLKLLGIESERLRVIVRDNEMVLFPLANQLHTKIFELLSAMSFKQDQESFCAWTIYRLATQLFNKTNFVGMPLWKISEYNGFAQACLVIVAEILDIGNSYGCKSANDRAALVSAILLTISKKIESGKIIKLDEIPNLVKEANQIYVKQGDIGMFQTLLDKSATPKIDGNLLIHAEKEIKSQNKSNDQEFKFSNFYNPGKLAAHKRGENLVEHLNINEIRKLSLLPSSLEYKIYDNYRISINPDLEIANLLLDVAVQRGGKGITNTLEVKSYALIEKKFEGLMGLNSMNCEESLLQLLDDIQIYKIIKSIAENSELAQMSIKVEATRYLEQVQRLLILVKNIVNLPGIADKDAEKIKLLFEKEEKSPSSPEKNEYYYFSQLKLFTEIYRISSTPSETSSYLLSELFSSNKSNQFLSGILNQISKIRFTPRQFPDLEKVIDFLSTFLRNPFTK